MEKKRYGKEPVPGRITLNFVKRNLLHLHERVCYAYRSLYFRVSGGFPVFQLRRKTSSANLLDANITKKYNENLIPELNRFGRNLMARPCLNLTFLLRQKNRGENPQR
jgi:hypothetical protein